MDRVEAAAALPPAAGGWRGRPPRDTRAILNGVLWILRTGAQWRELPARYPPYQTCHRRFQQWVRSGQLEKALRVLAKNSTAAGNCRCSRVDFGGYKSDWLEARVIIPMRSSR